MTQIDTEAPYTNADAVVGGSSLYVAVIDNESVAIVCSWRKLTPTVGVNSLGLIKMHIITHTIHITNCLILITQLSTAPSVGTRLCSRYFGNSPSSTSALFPLLGTPLGCLCCEHYFKVGMDKVLTLGQSELASGMPSSLKGRP